MIRHPREEECRKIFESLFHKKFPSVRPDWLRNPFTDRNIELDGFCDSVKTHLGKGLAFEYDSASMGMFAHLGRIRGELCLINRVVLIIIDERSIEGDLSSYIKTKLLEARVAFEEESQN